MRGFDDKECILRQSVCSRRFARTRCRCHKRTQCCGSRKGDRGSVSQVSRQIRQAAAATVRWKEASLNTSPRRNIARDSHECPPALLWILRLNMSYYMKAPCAWRLWKLAIPSKLQRVSTRQSSATPPHVLIAYAFASSGSVAQGSWPGSLLPC